jgi:4-diphosphocytidyl-2-C-methyl-D-erythritol kinase
MVIFPKAKINIGLRITGKRPDGFHDIETIFYPVSFCDALEFVISDGSANTDEFVVTGIRVGGNPESNLVIKAVRKIREIYPLPFLKIHLHKAIPAGAGLGGGSSDAAYMIKAINKHFNFSIGEKSLRSYALELGSDCPFFINPVPSVAMGRGDILKPVKSFLEGYFILLVNPGISISTKEAYMNTSLQKPETGLEQIINHKPSKWRKMLVNDFEPFVFKLFPQIEEMKRTLYKTGAIYSSMSGSGSTVYGIFESKPEIPDQLKEFVIYEGVL